MRLLHLTLSLGIPSLLTLTVCYPQPTRQELWHGAISSAELDLIIAEKGTSLSWLVFFLLVGLKMRELC
jgi:hypothetical protein